MMPEGIRAEVKRRLQRYAAHTRTEECFISEDMMAKWINGLIAAETERRAKIAEDCEPAAPSPLWEACQEAVAIEIREAQKNDSESK